MDDAPPIPRKSDLVKALIEVFWTPSHPKKLLDFATILGSIKRFRSMNQVASWAFVAFAAFGSRSGLKRSDLTRFLNLLLADRSGVSHDVSLRRLTAYLPLNTDIWMVNAILMTRSEQYNLAQRFLKRAAIISGRDTRAYNYLADHFLRHVSAQTPSQLMRRCTIIRPDDAVLNHDLAKTMVRLFPIDHAPSKRITNGIKRWIVLDPRFDKHGLDAIAWFRKLGDWRNMANATDRLKVLQATVGGQRVARHQLGFFENFNRQLTALAPLDVQRDFPARVMNSRVLIQPRLPHDGPWVIHGPAEQSERAWRILSYVNPAAQFLSADDPAAKSALRLSLLPSDDPDCWFLPCLYGHWHVYWTVLPAILGDDGVPSIERVVSYCIRTRQFVLFWYAKGHEVQYLRDHLDLGRSIAGRMADEPSKISYLETLSINHERYIHRFFETICHRVQYFDYAVYRPGDVILNLGVSEGFEIPAYLSLISPGGTLHNIDPEGYDLLGEPARQWIEGSRSEVYLHHIALSDIDGEIEMETGGCWEDARVSKRQMGMIKKLPSQRLDTFVRENQLDRIDHIKLDIEGGEGFLLDQLIELMRTHRPQIEISIYHTIEQFFDIPDRMMRESKGYNFYFYHYCGHFGEGTLYAIPKEISSVMPIRPQ
ncbi:MAG: FkbM family methyltransferase [Alphaproteobacteria bacterium]|nr:FkbM family methyltransferase [Alphaproteobacteria bacterium]